MMESFVSVNPSLIFICTQIYLDNLPSAEQYEKSFMHRDVVTHIAVARQTDYIITGSADGHVKFWKKMLTDIEFVKHFQVCSAAALILLVCMLMGAALSSGALGPNQCPRRISGWENACDNVNG